MAERTPTELLAGFARALRHAGLPITPDRTSAFARAVALTGLDQRSGTYWSGRATLCSSPADIQLYDQAFTAWFTPGADPIPQPRSGPARHQPAASLTTDSGTGEGDTPDVVAARASAAEVLRHRDVAALSPAERALLAAMFDQLDPRLPMRRAGRHEPHPRGTADLRRTLRAQLRAGGEVTRLRFRRRGVRPRPVVLLIDISGSMQPYADALLRLAHRLVQVWPRQVEVFTLGTRLTRVTAALQARRAEEALTATGRIVPDWSGGTRLGEVMGAFLRRWGRRGLARRAVVVVASDGWERGDAALLGERMRQLRLLARRVIWLNPHRGKPGYAPIQSGIVASLPHCDRLVAGHSFAAFAELLEVLADA